MFSNQKIHRAHAESLKTAAVELSQADSGVIFFTQGICYANLEDTIESVRDREHKYQYRMDVHETIESIMNEGFDEIYDNVAISKVRPESFEEQVEAIYLEAIGADIHKKGSYAAAAAQAASSSELGGKVIKGRIVLELRNFAQLADPTARTASLFVSTLDLSVDMLKQQLARDHTAMVSLGLHASGKPGHKSAPCAFQLGDVMRFAGDDEHSCDGSESRDECQDEPGRSEKPPASFSYRFVPFDITESLAKSGLRNGATVWVMPIQAKVVAGAAV
ncbi:hypothetical protein HK105_200783 [Polyrhizophydium stewartii]|uniref:Uncharacterized protein n=1 Tax=Polyrhizophydium stewartii TaxID=2732419 RepID=A0ABR4NK03_9FUNG|nr:hypothetical protein HK105_000396 [Polyrhizophydium stewartii]